MRVIDMFIETAPESESAIFEFALRESFVTRLGVNCRFYNRPVHTAETIQLTFRGIVERAMQQARQHPDEFVYLVPNGLPLDTGSGVFILGYTITLVGKAGRLIEMGFRPEEDYPDTVAEHVALLAAGAQREKPITTATMAEKREALRFLDAVRSGLITGLLMIENPALLHWGIKS